MEYLVGFVFDLQRHSETFYAPFDDNEKVILSTLSMETVIKSEENVGQSFAEVTYSDDPKSYVITSVKKVVADSSDPENITYVLEVDNTVTSVTLSTNVKGTVKTSLADGMTTGDGITLGKDKTITYDSSGEITATSVSPRSYS